jgi:hypothetical protein
VRRPRRNSIELGEAHELIFEIVTHEHDVSVERFLLLLDDADRAGVAEAWSPVRVADHGLRERAPPQRGSVRVHLGFI